MKFKRLFIGTFGLVVVGIILQSFNVIRLKDKMAKYENSDSVKIIKGKFQNIESTEVMQGMSGKTLKAFVKKGEKVPENPLPFVPFDSKAYSNSDRGILSVVWFGHSSALIEIDGKLILTDPALSKNAGPTSWTGTTRFHKAIPVTIEEFPELDVVLISHDHFDHLDKQSIQALNKKSKQFIVPLGVADYLRKWEVPEDKIIELSWWNDIHIEGIQFISTPARHFSGRGLFDRNTTLWSSWVIKGENHSVYFSGDSGYQKAFKEIGDKYGPFDLSLLECGQYNDDWGLIHMTPEESVQAGLDLNTQIALPIHWGAFNLSVHAWYEPVERFNTKAEELGLKMLAPQIGERVTIDSTVNTTYWWRKVR